MNCYVFQPLVLRLEESLQAGICGRVGGGHFNPILHMRGKESEKNYLNIEQILLSGGMLWTVKRHSNLG